MDAIDQIESALGAVERELRTAQNAVQVYTALQLRLREALAAVVAASPSYTSDDELPLSYEPISTRESR